MHFHSPSLYEPEPGLDLSTRSPTLDHTDPSTWEAIRIL